MSWIEFENLVKERLRLVDTPASTGGEILLKIFFLKIAKSSELSSLRY